RRQGSECTPKTAESYPELVRSFRIGKVFHHSHVGDDLFEAFVQYVVSSLLRLLIRTERDHFGIPRRQRLIRLVLLEHIAAWLHWRDGWPSAFLGDRVASGALGI